MFFYLKINSKPTISRFVIYMMFCVNTDLHCPIVEVQILQSKHSSRDDSSLYYSEIKILDKFQHSIFYGPTSNDLSYRL